jgi:hypothetical protein
MHTGQTVLRDRARPVMPGNRRAAGGCDLASKRERDRSHISLQCTYEARFWTRHLHVDLATLEATIAKVGNAATAVRRGLPRP